MNLTPRDSLFGTGLLDLDKVFDNFFVPTAPRTNESAFMVPRVDIRDLKDHYEIAAELPGIDKKNLSVQVNEGVMTIEASHDEEKSEEQEGRVIRRERRTGKFMRSFTLGTDIQESDIQAAFKDGLLTLTVPKTKPHHPVSRQINIQ
jgi:HSP20 family protein